MSVPAVFTELGAVLAVCLPGYSAAVEASGVGQVCDFGRAGEVRRRVLRVELVWRIHLQMFYF